MAGRLLAMLIAVTLGLIATVFLLNWLWMRAFGTVAAPQRQETPADRLEQRKELQAEHAAREKARREREKYSPEILKKAAHVEPPRPLSEAELDPATGEIHWPELLLSDEYGSQRAVLEEFLKQRAAGSPGADDGNTARAAAQEMLAILKENIRHLPADDYIAAHKFLESLIHSIRR